MNYITKCIYLVQLLLAFFPCICSLIWVKLNCNKNQLRIEKQGDPTIAIFWCVTFKPIIVIYHFNHQRVTKILGELSASKSARLKSFMIVMFGSYRPQLTSFSQLHTHLVVSNTVLSGQVFCFIGVPADHML